MTSAISAMETAYTDAASRSASDASNVNLGAGLIGGLTLTPGTYKWSVDINFATDIYLKGGPCDVFILEVHFRTMCIVALLLLLSALVLLLLHLSLLSATALSSYFCYTTLTLFLHF
jgi:hypothetical protein